MRRLMLIAVAILAMVLTASLTVGSAAAEPTANAAAKKKCVKKKVRKGKKIKVTKKCVKALKGKKGDPGANGSDGTNGSNGSNGSNGAPGTPGTNGDGSKIGLIKFSKTGYVPGNINGQNGWSKTGGYDVEVEEVDDFLDATGYGFGDQALRMSNATTSGSFGDQTFSPGLADEAGETDCVVTGGSGDLQPHLELSFDIGTTDATEQPGLRTTDSPDGGAGSRMSFLAFADTPAGVVVTFFDVDNPGPVGTVSNFVGTDIATLSRTQSHSIKFDIEFVEGPDNDVVNVYIDGVLEHTGGTWEDYYRYDPEQNGNGNLVPCIRKALFRLSGTAAPGTAGRGFLVDNLFMQSSPN